MNKNVSMYEIAVVHAGNSVASIGTSGLNPCVGVFCFRPADEHTAYNRLVASHVPASVDLQCTLSSMLSELDVSKSPEAIEVYLVSGMTSGNSPLDKIVTELEAGGITNLKVINQDRFALDVNTGRPAQYMEDSDEFKNLHMVQFIAHQNPPQPCQIVYRFDGRNDGQKMSLRLRYEHSVAALPQPIFFRNSGSESTFPNGFDSMVKGLVMLDKDGKPAFPKGVNSEVLEKLKDIFRP